MMHHRHDVLSYRGNIGGSGPHHSGGRFIMEKMHQGSPNTRDGVPVKVSLVQVSSPHHYALWNALSVDTLAGHLRGVFLESDVQVSVDRIRSDQDMERFLDSLALLPDVIGISAELGSLDWTVQLLKGIRSHRFDGGHRPLVVLGSVLPTCLPGVFLKEYPEAIVVKGEGEEALQGIVDFVRGKKTLDEVPSLVYRKGDERTTTARRPPDLSTLEYPPALDTIAEVLHHDGNVLVETSRGCPWSSCAYCAIRASRHGKGWEPLPKKRVEANLEQLVRAGVHEFEFADADILGGIEDHHLDRVRWLCGVLNRLQANSGRKISFRAFLTPQIFCKPGQLEVSDGVEGVFRDLKDAGMSRAYIGIESGSESQLRRYHRSTTPAQLEYAIHLLRDEIGVAIDVGFLMFDPDLTLDEMLENIAFFERLDLFDANQWPFRPIRLVPETPMCKQMRKQGRLGKFNHDLLAYQYVFKDPRVQEIHDTVDALSAETRDIFYALKVVAKLQFDGKEGRPETNFADKMVKANAHIYIALMSNLAKALKDGPTDGVSIVDQARLGIHNLLEKILHEVQEGSLQAHAAFLMPKLERCSSQHRIMQ